jgi:hypothetical protein
LNVAEIGLRKDEEQAGGGCEAWPDSASQGLRGGGAEASGGYSDNDRDQGEADHESIGFQRARAEEESDERATEHKGTGEGPAGFVTYAQTALTAEEDG